MKDNHDVTVSVDRGEGREIDAEVSANSLWLRAGVGIETADMWMREVGGVADLRICISRQPSGIEISVDRGEQSPRWWKLGEEPRLSILLQPELGIATATAKAGAEMHSMGSVAL